MIVFKMVNCASILILTFLLFCTKYSIVEAKENVKFVKTLTESYDQEEQQDIDSPTFIDIWEHVMKKTNLPEKSRTLDDENRVANSVRNNKRFSRHTNNGYSSVYPVLTTPYPSVQFNPNPYRQPAGQHYGATQYTSNFNSYPVHQSYSNNSTNYNRQTYQNTTFNYPPYNSVSFRPAHPPGQNLFYGNASTNTAQRPYNQSKPQYPNTSAAPQNNWSSKPNYFNYNNQITNQTMTNPNYNPLGNLILNGYGSNYTSHYSNPATGRAPYYSQITTPAAPWLNKTTSKIPVNDRNYPFNNHFNQRINNTINQYQHNGSHLNYPSYNTTNTVRNNTNIGSYQWTSTNSHNTTRFNIPNIPQKGSWSNSSMTRNPIYNQSNSFNRVNQNQWPYNQSLDNSGNMNRNQSYNNGPQSSMPNYPVNNSSYSHQLPYVPSNYPLKTDFQNSTRFNNIPNQNNYMEPNHFFYTPGYNLSSYDHRKDSAQKFSYA